MTFIKVTERNYRGNLDIDAGHNVAEHHLDMVGVGGSSPLGRTILLIYLSPYRVILPVVSSLLDRSISHVDCAELPPSTIRNAT